MVEIVEINKAKYKRIRIDGLSSDVAMTTEHIDISKLELPLYGAYAEYDNDTEELRFIDEYVDGCVSIIFPSVSDLYYAEDNIYEEEDPLKYDLTDNVYLCDIMGSTEYDITTLINIYRINSFMEHEFCELEGILFSDLHWDIKTKITPDFKFVGNDKFESCITYEDTSWIYIQSVEHVKDEDYNVICDNGLRIELGNSTCLGDIQKFVIFIYAKDTKVYKVMNFDPDTYDREEADFNNSLISDVLYSIVDEVFCLNRIPDPSSMTYHTDMYSSYVVKQDDSIMKYKYTSPDGRVY